MAFPHLLFLDLFLTLQKSRSCHDQVLVFVEANFNRQGKLSFEALDLLTTNLHKLTELVFLLLGVGDLLQKGILSLFQTANLFLQEIVCLLFALDHILHFPDILLLLGKDFKFFSDFRAVQSFYI